jgi:hypothetical protein
VGKIRRHTGWAVRKPREPKLKETTGGIALRNRFEACRITPSPPRQTTKSTLSCSSLHIISDRDLTRMKLPQINMKQIFQKQSTVSLNLEAMSDCENCSRITAQQTSIGITNTPGVMVVEGLDKSITWKPGKHVMHIRLHHHIHAFLMEQKGCNLLKA